MIRRKRKRGRGRLRRLFRPGPIGHTAKGVAYHIGNSIRGLHWMFRIGKRRADRDVLITSDGVLVNTHWGRPLAHGFVDPQGKLGRLTLVRNMTWAEVSRLRSKRGNYRINKLETDLAEMGRLGYKLAVIEPKSWPGLDNFEVWREVKAMGDAFDVPLRGWVLPGNKRLIPYMEAAGIPTKVVGGKR